MKVAVGATIVASNSIDPLSTPPIIIAPGLTERVRIDSSGNVGIGTINPLTQLQIGNYMTMQGSNSNYMGVIGFNRDVSIGTILNSSYGAYQLHNNDGNFIIQNYNSAGSDVDSYNFVIHSSGNVGIGTNNPLEKLDVYNTIRISGSATDFMNISGRIIRGTNGTNGSGVFFSSSTLLPANKDGTLTDNGIDLGNGSYRWRVVYAGTGTINTSDRNMKDNIQDLEENEIKVATELSDMIKTFKFKDAIKEKGKKARIHTGFIAQEVEDVFNKYELDATKYGLLCIDNVYKVDGEKVDKEGNIYTKESHNVEVEKVYGVRMVELLCFMNSGLNNKYKNLLERIEALENNAGLRL
jgi:hypothetical protein